MVITSASIPIAVVGAGLIGPRHAMHVKKSSRSELFAIIDPSSKAKTLACDLKTKYFPSIKTMIHYCKNEKIPYPQGAIVCTPNSTHAKVAAELASHGIHLLIEKPISSRVEESMAIEEYTSMKKVRLLVGHHRRFNSHVEEVKKNLHKLGDIIAIQGSWTLRKPDSYFVNSPWRTNSKTGGGALLINLIHDIDILQYLFGLIEKVYVELLSRKRSKYDNVDEGAVLTLRFANGICGTFICSDNVTSPFNFESGTGENPTIPKHDGLEGVYRIFGTKGTLSFPDMSLYSQANAKSDDQNSWLEPVLKDTLVSNREETLYKKLPFDLQLLHFIDIIERNVVPLCGSRDGISALLCIDAVLRSIESGLPQYVQSASEVKPDYEALGLDTLEIHK